MDFDESFLEEFHTFIRKNSHVAPNIENYLAESKKQDSKFHKKLQDVVSQDQFEQYLVLQGKLTQASSFIIRLVNRAATDTLSKTVIKEQDRVCHDLIYKQEYSPDLVYKVTENYLRTTVPELADELTDKLKGNAKSKKTGVAESQSSLRKNDIVKSNAALSQSTPQLSSYAKDLVDEKTFEKTKKKRIAQLEEKHTISNTKPVTPVFERYNFDGNILRDLEPYKAHIGETPAYKIAELIENENPDLAKALQRSRGSIIGGLDHYRFFGE